MEINQGYENVKKAIQKHLSNPNIDIKINPSLPKNKLDKCPEKFKITVGPTGSIDVSREELEDSKSGIRSDTNIKIKSLKP